MNSIDVIGEARYCTSSEQTVCASSVDFCCPLPVEGVAGAANCTTSANHVVNNGDYLAVDVEIFGCMFNCMSVYSSLLEIAEVPSTNRRYLCCSIDGTLVWT